MRVCNVVMAVSLGLEFGHKVVVVAAAVRLGVLHGHAVGQIGGAAYPQQGCAYGNAQRCGHGGLGIHGADDFAHEFEAAHDPYSAIIVKALADRLAEAFAEFLHKQARVAWGYEKQEDFTNEDLVKERYRGIRPAPGYPSQPDHTEKPTLFQLLDATAATGITLTESCAMSPASSVSGMYFNHPDGKYFAVGKLGRDQIEDYASRKKISVADAEKWLGPYLDYTRT